MRSYLNLLPLEGVGESPSLSQIARNIRVGQDGSNAADICAYLKALNVPYLAVKTTSLDAITSSLAPAKRAAILHVDKESTEVLPVVWTRMLGL